MESFAKTRFIFIRTCNLLSLKKCSARDGRCRWLQSCTGGPVTSGCQIQLILQRSLFDSSRPYQPRGPRVTANDQVNNEAEQKSKSDASPAATEEEQKKLTGQRLEYVTLDPSASPVPESLRARLKLAQFAQHPNNSKIDLRQPKTVNGIKFLPFYHFPYIIAFRAFVRLKFYQTCLTIIMVPFAAFLQSSGISGPNAVFWAIGVNVFAMTTLYIFGRLFQRWVGRIYLDESGQYVLISHLTFTGGRADLLCETVNVLPLDEDPTDAFVQLKLQSRPDVKLYCGLRWGGVLDEKAFKTVFGESAIVVKPQRGDALDAIIDVLKNKKQPS